MLTGITFDEKILRTQQLEYVLEILSSLGCQGFELAVHPNLMPMEQYKSVCRQMTQLGFKLTFHEPSFIDDTLFNVKHFSTLSDVKKVYEALFDNMMRLDLIQNTPMLLTLHGARYEHLEERPEVLDQNRMFLEWALNQIIKRKLPIQLAMETLSAKKVLAIGNSRTELVDLACEFSTDHLGICWDITHDASNQKDAYVHPDKSFMKHVINVHVHGLSEIEHSAHLPMFRSDSIYKDQIQHLQDQGYKGLTIFELLFDKCDDYWTELQKDLIFIQESYSV